MKSKNLHSIIIRCDGSSSVGLGHVVRCLALAKRLSENPRVFVHFVIRTDETAKKMVEQHGYAVTFSSLDLNKQYGTWLLEVVEIHKAKILVLDCRDGLTCEEVNQIKKRGIFVASIDDIEEKRIACNAVFYPPIPQVKTWNWEGFSGVKYWGWEYSILREEFCQIYTKSHNKKPKLIVSMGGSDPKQLTYKILSVLFRLKFECEVNVIIGSANKQKAEIVEYAKKATNIYVFENPSNIAQLMSEADLAIISFGVTAYEIVAMRTPAILICLFAEQMDSAKTFEENNFAINLGVYHMVTDSMIANALTELLSNTKKRTIMQKQLSSFPVSNGAKNISDILISKLI